MTYTNPDEIIPKRPPGQMNWGKMLSDEFELEDLSHLTPAEIAVIEELIEAEITKDGLLQHQADTERVCINCFATFTVPSETASLVVEDLCETCEEENGDHYYEGDYLGELS